MSRCAAVGRARTQSGRRRASFAENAGVGSRRRYDAGGQARSSALDRLHRLAFDLADALGRHAVLVGEILQRRRVVLAQPARLDDPAAAIVELGERARQSVGAVCSPSPRARGSAPARPRGRSDRRSATPTSPSSSGCGSSAMSRPDSRVSISNTSSGLTPSSFAMARASVGRQRGRSTSSCGAG